MKYINLLNSSKRAIIDDASYDIIHNFTWTLHSKGYASTWDRESKKYFLMHRLITNPPDDLVVDHINHNPLDNRRLNLRICTQSQNRMNSLNYKNNKTGFKGVMFCKDGKRLKRYVAEIHINNKKIKSQYFSTAEEAAKEYVKMAKKYHREFAFNAK